MGFANTFSYVIPVGSVVLPFSTNSLCQNSAKTRHSNIKLSFDLYVENGWVQMNLY